MNEFLNKLNILLGKLSDIKKLSTMKNEIAIFIFLLVGLKVTGQSIPNSYVLFGYHRIKEGNKSIWCQDQKHDRAWRTAPTRANLPYN